ncbi:YqcI/YcgG family protein [Neobacillus drentensis]|uniref:YqcI/YcgG family protein n=1 Tax=Neobacillus drentensis TaxID=220684 RepID=UPI00300085B4
MKLYTKESLDHMALEKWKRDAFEKFEQKIADKHKPFPCIPATQGHQLHHFRYGFVSNPESADSPEELAQLLQEYSKSFRKLGNYTSLIVFYEPDPKLSEHFAIEDYEQHFWTQLTKISEQDPIQWPSHIPQDPQEPLWEFCFHGEQYFMYCATPAHKNRLSRSFPYLMLAITPRWVLEEFYSAASHASKIKANIRKRLQAYDSVPIHPDLNSYGQEDNYEWKQYFLHDDDSSHKECPFHPRNEKTSKD